MSDEVSQIRLRMQELDQERQTLERRLRELEQLEAAVPAAIQQSKPLATNASSATDKIALFRRLFGGRTDVFPARWDNPKTGRSGYAPACTNEWVRGVCGKPHRYVLGFMIPCSTSFEPSGGMRARSAP
jgi:hypothetical protein